MKLWLLLFLTILSISLGPVAARAQIPSFVRPGLVVSYSGTVTNTPGSNVKASSQVITVNTVTVNTVIGTTVVTTYLSTDSVGNSVVTDGSITVSWSCTENRACILDPPQLGAIAQFWLDPTNPTGSILGPKGEAYTNDTCPSEVVIPNLTCLESRDSSTPPPNGPTDPTYDLLLAFDTTGLVQYSDQRFEPIRTFQGDVGQFKYTLQNRIPWQVAGANLLLQGDSGEVQIWQPDGTETRIETPDASWHIMNTNYIKPNQNFNVLWQNNNGAIAVWGFNGTNGTNRILDGVVGTAPPGWRAVGIGDFFDRNVSDILFQNNSGEVAIWQMNGLQATPYAVVPNDVPEPEGWHAIGTGDFNGDGFADILFQHDDGAIAVWLMRGNTVIQYAYVDVPAPDWHAVGTGDFLGRGVSDILFQRDDGAVGMWVMNGTSVLNYLYVADPGPDWHIKGVCNCNQTLKSDILLQNDSGDVDMWEMNGTSSYGHKSLGNPGSGLHL